MMLQFFVMNMNYTTESLEHRFLAGTMHIIAVDEKKDYNLRIERKTVLRALEVGLPLSYFFIFSNTALTKTLPSNICT